MPEHRVPQTVTEVRLESRQRHIAWSLEALVSRRPWPPGEGSAKMDTQNRSFCYKKGE